MTDPTDPKPSDEPADEPQPAQEPHTPQTTPPAADAEVPAPDVTVPSGSAPVGTPGPAKRSTVRPWAVGSLALVIALGAAVAIGTVAGDDAGPAASANSSTSAAPSSPATTTAAPTSAAPTTAAPTSAAPSPTTAAPPPKPPSYKTLSERQWKLIAKNPDAHIGKTYVVYGRVTQFDAATGVDNFRADVAHRRMADEYDYETNTLLTGLSSDLENLVQDDIFRANVTVLSSFSYDTQIGGETTVPLLQVDSIKVL
ncbi:hypothetical protein NCC78_04075 [Micromonospora phytophila]|uniref:hypothetical protein n=1 Tax=Micromonospora phytophila TaxID=709888 RepID=UPI00202DFEF7|nr:hypothetical protein [Micromonospora phytophila]MCM0673885.1 hypothetical protein [Micromonospora phytophila]